MKIKLAKDLIKSPKIKMAKGLYCALLPVHVGQHEIGGTHDVAVLLFVKKFAKCDADQQPHRPESL
jgi:hypothetical protein